jgi:hypothetical protein
VAVLSGVYMSNAHTWKGHIGNVSNVCSLQHELQYERSLKIGEELYVLCYETFHIRIHHLKLSELLNHEG